MITMIMFVLTIGNAFAGLDVDAGAEAGAEANNNQTFEAAERPFPVPGTINLPALPGYFGDNNRPGHQFISLDKLMMYNTDWKIKDKYEPFAGGRFNLTPHADKVAAEDRTKVVTCTKNIFDKTKVDVTLLAVGAVNSTNKNTISSDLLDKVLYEASLYGATHIQFLAEGTNTELSTTGWGIGFNHTEANSGSMTTGGTGFSTGWAGYNNLPWQQFFFLKVVDPNAVAEVEVKDAKTEMLEQIVDSKIGATEDTVIKSESLN